MLKVEDCLEKLDEIHELSFDFAGQYSSSPLNNWDHRFISDVCSHVRENKPVSTEQGKIILKLIERYRNALETAGVNGFDIDALLRTPVYRHPPYTSVQVKREVRWLGDNKLAFRCKYNAGIVEDIKRLKGTNYFLGVPHPWFNRDFKLWIVDVNSGNLERVMDVIRRHQFSFDAEVEQYFLQAANSIGQHSSVDMVDGELVIEVKDDDFLNAWISGLSALEGDDV